MKDLALTQRSSSGDNDMEVEIANAPPSALSGAPSAGLPMFSPVDFFRDNNGHMCDVNTVNSHTVVLGRSGEGKTHLTVHLIMQWANVKGWSYGWVGAIMPRAVSDVCACETQKACALTSPPRRRGTETSHTTTCWTSHRCSSLTTIRQRKTKRHSWSGFG